mgnify:CR=1 FL=1
MVSVGLLAVLVTTSQAPARASTVTGQLRIEPAFESKILGNRRPIRVWLPPGYDQNPGRRYPVTYYHDGQNIFDAATSFIGQEWRVDETATSLIQAGLLPPMIIVGVDNTGASRLDEYFATRATFGRGDRTQSAGGKADDYGRFLTEELMPWVNRTYRTQTGPRNTALVGSSAGGNISLHLGLTRPQTFGRLGLMSPALWWDDREMIRRIPSLTARPNLRVWIDCGTAEGNAHRDAKALFEAMQAKGWRPGQDVVYVEEGFGEHNEAAWARRTGAMLLWLWDRAR